MDVRLIEVELRVAWVHESWGRRACKCHPKVQGKGYVETRCSIVQGLLMVQLLSETCEDTRMKPTGHGLQRIVSSNFEMPLARATRDPEHPFRKKKAPFESDSKSRDERYYDS